MRYYHLEDKDNAEEVRGIISGTLGIKPELNPDRLSDAKAVIFEGFQKAIDDGAPKESCGILVDEQFGADIVRRAKKEGYLFAMPTEKSGQDEYEFEYGNDFGKHIEEFDPAFSKVLVRYKDLKRESNRLAPLRETEMASENEALVAKASEEAALATWHGAQASVTSAEAALGAMILVTAWNAYMAWSQNSQILAQAIAGAGGAIDIIATSAFISDPTSIVDASSTRGISGTVNIQAPLQNVGGELTALSQEFSSAAAAGRRMRWLS